MKSTRSLQRRHTEVGLARRIGGAGTALVLALAILQIEATPSRAGTTASCSPRTTSTDWKAAVADAKTALAKAQSNIAQGHYTRAAENVRIMKRKTQIANTAATALIGKPPTDPESDDPPGPTAVQKVGGLDHQVTLALVPLFAGAHGTHLVPPLTHGLLQADACRDTMLETVIALKPGKRDDYVDGLSDTLNTYPKELSAIAAELESSSLGSGARDALTMAQQVVTHTNDAMQHVFGGGERTALSPRS
jgi:hypothetical protein